MITDSAQLYKYWLRDFASHGRGDHSKTECTRYEPSRQEIHTNTVEDYFSVFKRGMRGTYQHCKEKHLHRYLAEFDFFCDNRSAIGIEDKERATKADRCKGQALDLSAALPSPRYHEAS